MAHYIDKDALIAEIEELKTAIDIKLRSSNDSAYWKAQSLICERLEFKVNSLEVKEADNVWHEVDDVNMPQPDKKKIYCVLSLLENKYLLARVREHPHDELLQWKCTEFPYHCYDMCEGDKYMQIV